MPLAHATDPLSRTDDWVSVQAPGSVRLRKLFVSIMSDRHRCARVLPGSGATGLRNSVGHTRHSPDPALPTNTTASHVQGSTFGDVRASISSRSRRGSLGRQRTRRNLAAGRELSA